MKSTIKLIAIVLGSTLIAISCKKKDDPAPGPTVYYQQQDQMGRPAINTVFNVGADKETFNVTPPANMNAAFQAKFQARLLALNAGYTTNALGQTAAGLTSLLATDVLNVKTTGTTTFFDGNPANTLSGRTLADDVINVELLLLFGGPNGTDNPGLTNDNVNGNDKAFLAAFPYLAAPF